MARNPNRNSGQRQLPRWVPWAAGGLTLLAAGTLGYALTTGESRPASDATPTPDGTVPATASQYPGTPSPSISAPNVITTSSASPSATETSPSATASKPTDVWLDRRVTAARRYAGCRLDSFTNDGTVKTADGKRIRLNLDMNFTSDDASANLRQGGQSADLKWSSPQIVLYGIDGNGNPTGSRINNAEEPGGDVNPTNTAAFVPVNAGKGSTYVVAVETTASTPAEGGHNVTTVDLACGAVQDLGGDNWRPYNLDLGAAAQPVVINGYQPN